MPRHGAIILGDLEPFRLARPVWDRAVEMILIAARTGESGDVAEPTPQMLVAVERENWWKPADLRHKETSTA